MDLQSELEAARAIEKSVLDVQTALAGLDDEGRRAVLIRALAAVEINNEPNGDNWCTKCGEYPNVFGRAWCVQCAKDHASKIREGKLLAARGDSAASRFTKKRHAAAAQGRCTKCLKNSAADGKRWCVECKTAYDASTKAPVADTDSATTVKNEPDLDREIVEKSIMSTLKDGPKDLFSITKTVWGVATIDMQRRAKKILWAMKFDNVLKMVGEQYAIA